MKFDLEGRIDLKSGRLHRSVRPAEEVLGSMELSSEINVKDPMQHSLRILLVEDEAETRRAVQRFLEFRGHTVATAKSRSTAIDKAAALDPDLLICDWKLGDDDGVEVASELKSRYEMLVVMVTAHSLSEVRQRARECDVDISAFRRKPVSLPDLASLVEGLSQPAAPSSPSVK